MLEVKRITTCTMPHGSRLSPDGTNTIPLHVDDMLAEIDTRKFAVSRYFGLSAEKKWIWKARHDRNENGRPVRAPTWAQPSNDGSEIYVACNKSTTSLSWTRPPGKWCSASPPAMAFII